VHWVATGTRCTDLRGLGGAALTTAFGAGLGAAIGDGSGAATGALAGGGLAAVHASRTQTSIQTQYDIAFAQCMFSLGNAVSAMGPMMTEPQR
jgi:hypothetical protein